MSNFKNMDKAEALMSLMDEDGYTVEDVMSGLTDVFSVMDLITKEHTVEDVMEALEIEEMELVCWFAEENVMLWASSERALSERFDKEVMPTILKQHGEIGEEFHDQPMVDQEFSFWIDGLCRDGEVHELQYDQWEYVGKWSDCGS